MLNIIGQRKITFIISGLLFVSSIVLLFVFGLKPGIDFTGGSLLEIKFRDQRPDINQMQEVLQGIDSLELGSVLTQPSGDDKMLLRMRFLSEDEHQSILLAIREEFGNMNSEQAMPDDSQESTLIEENGGIGGAIKEDLKPELIELDTESEAIEGVNFELPAEDVMVDAHTEEQTAPAILEERFETIGPSISSHLRERAIYAAIAVVMAIILYVGYAFRKVSKPVKSWKYGVAAIIALIHDVIITMAIFALLGRFAGVEIDIPFVVALLTIMGYSVNDTIVVFDRVRENLIKRGSDKFAETVNLGVNQTITRSINTSLTTLLVLLALFFFGGDSIHYFSLTLILGIIFGTYSSVFLASPLLVAWERLKHR